MLGILLIYFIWKKFADLALSNGKKKWVYGLLGIVIYYAFFFIGGVSIVLISVLFEATFFTLEENEFVLSLVSIPIGLLACWLFYLILQKQWGKRNKAETDALDADLLATHE